MRILHVVHRFNPPCRGGLSTYVSRICELQSREHNVEVWTTLEDERPRAVQTSRYLIRRFPSALWLTDNPMPVSMFRHMLCTIDKEFDVVVAHSHLMLTSLIATCRASLSSTPFVLISHGFSVKRGVLFNLLEGAYLSTVSRGILQAADRIVAMSGVEATRLVSLGIPEDQIARIHQGVDCGFFKPGRSPRDARLLVWAGRFVPEKNLDFLVRMFALLRRKIDARLVLAGDGPERNHIRDLSRDLNLADSISFPGLLNAREIASLLRQATAFLLPSTNEGVPLILLEAMASGLPLLVSRGLGLEEYAGEAALFLPQNSEDDWVQGCETILRDHGKMLQLGQTGRSLAIRHNWESVVQLLQDVLDDVTRKM
ncbi:MAG: glycosyltransferase family 4 protein [Candidatus Bathyarchaeia archaeon]